MKTQTGFTLIELVMVIVILGILAAFALPRFADLSGQARVSVGQGATGAVKSAMNIAHSQALATRQTGATATISMDGVTVDLVFGYPAATTAGIGAAANLSASDFDLTPSAGQMLLVPKGITPSNINTCSLIYHEATGVGAPAVATPSFTNCD